MNKAVPWRIRGVPFDARTAAIEAARRSGMSLGEWLNSVIADQAAADGLDGTEVDRDAELDAVTHRLIDLRDRTCEASEGAGTNRIDYQPRRMPRHDRDETRERRPVPLDTSRGPRSEIDAEALLENAIAAFDRRANRSSERTARALAEVAELIDSGKREREREEQALSTIAERLSGLERRAAQPTAPPSDPHIHEALARLEQRIERLAQPEPAAPSPRELAASAPAGEPPAEPIRPPTDSRSEAPPPSRRPLASAIAEVARRQQELDAAQPFRKARPAMVRPPMAEPNPLEQRLAALVERLERTAERRPEPARVPEVVGLQGNIDSLTDRIERMRSDLAARNASRADDGIEQIRRELAAMSSAVGDLAPRASITALEGAVRDLSARIEVSRHYGVGDSALAPVEALAREILQVVRNTDPRAAIAALDRRIEAMAARLEAFEGKSVANPDVARGIAEQTRDMRDSLARILANQVPAERIERGLAELGDRIETLVGGGADPLGRGEMAQRVGEIRAMLADPFSQERSLHVLERRLEAMTSRIDAMFGERLDTMQRTLAAGFEQARTQVAPAAPAPNVETLVEDLGARIDSALSGGLAAMERKVARLIENAAPKVDPQTTQLEAMVRDLAARVDAGAAADARPDALDAIQHQIARLSEHFDRSDRTAETLTVLQTSVADLFRRLEETHENALERAESAARRAAADALRQGEAAPNGQTVQELADIRALQDAADHRTHATLTAVHDTLAQVVHRLTSLEDDLADVRADIPAPGSSFTAPAPSPSPTPVTRSAPFVAPVERAPSRENAERRVPASAPHEATDEDDVLIEPGMALGRLGATPADERTEYRPQASFIQAARRAAQAASTSAPARPAAPAAVGKGEAMGGTVAALDTVRAYYASRKRPILLSLAALMMIFGAWQVAKVVVDERMQPSPASQTPKASSLPVPRDAVAERPMPAPVAPRKADLAPAGDAPASAPAAQASAPAAQASAPASPTSAPAAQAAPASAPAVSASPAPGAPSASIGAFDRMPVGSIGRAEPPVDTNGIVRALAVTGDAAAQYELAVRYADGRLLARDPKLSTQWFEKAAEQGLIPAQYRLGAAYERGIGVPKDLGAARKWYAKAAESGNARAMHNLAVLYADGSDGKPDYANAITWFRRAFELGVRDSQYNLAILYARGLGTPVNMVESYVWFAAAAAQGDDDAGKKRDDVAGRLPANDLARAKALAEAFRPKTLDAVANDVAPPPGGWEAVKPPARPDAAKAPARAKLSNL